MTTSIDNPILNSPYERPDRHYMIGPNGPTGEIRDGRREPLRQAPVEALSPTDGVRVQAVVDDADPQLNGKVASPAELRYSYGAAG